MKAFIPAACLCLAACASGNNLGSGGATTEQPPVRVLGAGGPIQLTTSTTDQVRVGTVARDPAQVWADLPAAYRSLGIEVSEINNNNRIFGNPELRIRRRLGSVALAKYLDCGRTQDGPNADTYEVVMSVLTQLKTNDEGGTMVITSVGATARPVNYVTNEVTCTTTGALEERLFSALNPSR